MIRCTHVSSRTTWAARENAVSTAAASPTSESTHTFDVVSSQTIGASEAAAVRLAVTAGRGAHSTATRSAPSRAAAGVSATISATGSPTKRTRPRASGGRFIVGGNIMKPW